MSQKSKVQKNQRKASPSVREDLKHWEKLQNENIHAIKDEQEHADTPARMARSRETEPGRSAPPKGEKPSRVAPIEQATKQCNVSPEYILEQVALGTVPVPLEAVERAKQEHPPEAGPQLYPLMETARRVGLSDAYILELIKAGKVRSLKLGTSRLVYINDLIQYQETPKIKGGGPKKSLR